MNISSVTILICTYNRAPLLRETLAEMQEMTAPAACAVDILVVDNNSTDDTAMAVAHAAKGARFPVRLLSERQQGKSFALNTGLSHASGDVLALTDDDVLPARDWLVRIVDAFRARTATFVFGKVLPRWSCAPPPELLTLPAQDIWGPLAIVDYGDDPVVYGANNTGQRLPIGANLAFLRSALVAIGGWRTDLGKVNNTLISGEDHEIFMRLRRHGLYSGYYEPAMTVRHYVPASRLTRRYFRRWFYWSGITHAIMFEDLYPELDMAVVPRIAGVPRFACRQGLAQAWRWAATRRGDALTALVEELRLLQYIGLFVQCWRQRRRQPDALRRVGVAALVVWLSTAAIAGAAGKVQLTIDDGRVWLVTRGATVAEILSEWARVGGTRIDNAASVSGGPVDLELAGVPEEQALQVLLRDANVVVTGRPANAAPGAHASRIERILIVPPGHAAPDRPPLPLPSPSDAATPASVAPSPVQPIIGLNGLPVPDDQQ